EQPDVRVDPFDDLAVQFHYQPEDPVRGRVLRAEVDRVIVDRLIPGIARVSERLTLGDATDIDLDLALAAALFGAGVGHDFFFRGFFAAGAFLGSIGAGPLAAGAGDGAPGSSGTAFSSPGRRYSGPSHGIRKSKVRKSCGSWTGS